MSIKSDFAGGEIDFTKVHNSNQSQTVLERMHPPSALTSLDFRMMLHSEYIIPLFASMIGRSSYGPLSAYGRPTLKPSSLPDATTRWPLFLPAPLAFTEAAASDWFWKGPYADGSNLMPALSFVFSSQSTWNHIRHFGTHSQCSHVSIFTCSSLSI